LTRPVVRHYDKRMTSYRVQYTEVKPGGSHAKQDESVRGTLDDVRDYLDSRRVYGRDPITVTEFEASDSAGRVVPASEWDI
jgi:hypothetical protein